MVLKMALVSIKPGVGKTTSALFICQSLHELGKSPLLVDADKGQSALEWMEDAEGLDFPVVGQHITTLHRNLPDLEGDRGAVVIDVPQLEDHESIARGALLYADVWVFPIAPAGIEVRRTTRKLKKKLEGIKDERERFGLPRDPAVEVVLLNRTNRPYATKTGPDADVRDALMDGELSMSVLDSQVVFHDDLYRQCYGLPVETEGTTYPAVTKEILSRWEAAQ
ncbi:ParA family protein [Streptomyces mirabilis]|uniref:ParA family protein n=1 Tax=Streptomyces mirabilis TaxID=68239 RepID=UPI00225A0BE8|nr:ParA family protein [Streptomyces mirabilis]MCX4429433.1 ParA family protein [Streptomyces mirabilis]